ncbi:MAG TPA: metallophosphoesterase [Candidatus Cottocaccamicrobium excrementipullorum]|nr:metallophosphoesterase [Candidatus Cottocaccamicrobium excrementipullorum]
MALYAIGDLHLSFSVNKPMDVFGPQWKNHVSRIRENWLSEISPEDTVVVTGDHSWGRNLEEARADLEFIAALPGRKILLRGNHDMFWDAKKTGKLNQEFKGRLEFLQNNYYTYNDYALVGTKGYCDEGRDTIEQLEKLLSREEVRLRTSFEMALGNGYRKFIMFLHYPPTSIYEQDSRFTRMAQEYGAETVVYSHCHGWRRYGDSIRGNWRGVEYRLVSSDYLEFMPARIR